jgi:S-adenosylmethionine synthetase
VIADARIAEIVAETVDLRPAAIIDYFELRRPIYAPLSAYGHFGREELGVKWEQTDIAATLSAKAGI